MEETQDPPLNPQQFSAKIKAKYPQYKDVDDVVLAKKMVEKYPEYAKKVSFGEVKKKGSSEPTSQEGAGVSPTRTTQPSTSSDTEPPTRAQASGGLGGPFQSIDPFGGKGAVGAIVSEQQKTATLPTKKAAPAVEKENTISVKGTALDKNKEEDGFVDYLIKSVDSGIATVSKSIYDTPALIYDAAASLTNPIARAFGGEEASSEKFAETFGLRNIPSEMLKEKIDRTNKSIQEYNDKNGGDALTAIQNGNYTGAAKMVAGTTMQSLPLMVAAMATGGESLAMTGIGVSAASTKASQLKEENPEMDVATRTTNAAVSGILEATLGHLLNGASGAVVKKIITDKGVEAGSKIVSNSIKNILEKNIEKNPVIGLFGEVVEESLVEFGDQANDILAGKRDSFNYKDIANAGISATGMGATNTVAVYGAKGFVSSKDYIKAKNINKEISKLTNELSNENLSDTDKGLISNKINRLVVENQKIIGDGLEKVNVLPEDIKKNLLEVNSKLDDIKSQAFDIKDNNNISDETKKTLLDELKLQFKTLEDERVNILSGKTTAGGMSVKVPEKNVFYYYEAKGEKAPAEVPAGYTSVKKVENSEEVKLWNAQKPSEVTPTEVKAEVAPVEDLIAKPTEETKPAEVKEPAIVVHATVDQKGFALSHSEGIAKENILEPSDTRDFTRTATPEQKTEYNKGMAVIQTDEALDNGDKKISIVKSMVDPVGREGGATFDFVIPQGNNTTAENIKQVIDDVASNIDLKGKKLIDETVKQVKNYIDSNKPTEAKPAEIKTKSGLDLPKVKDEVNNSPVTDRDENNQDLRRFIPFSIVEEANKNDRLSGQTARQIAQRGGYSVLELNKLLPNWKEMLPNAKPAEEVKPAEVKEPTIVVHGAVNGYGLQYSEGIDKKDIVTPQDGGGNLSSEQQKSLDKYQSIITKDEVLDNKNKSVTIITPSADNFGRSATNTFEFIIPEGNTSTTEGIKSILDNVTKTDLKGKEVINESVKQVKNYIDSNKPTEVKAEEVKAAEVKEIVAPKEDLTAGKGLFSEPVEHVIKTAEDYKKSKGITVDAGERITDIDVENSKKIADAYDEMQSNPNDPEVKAAYNAMANETMDQFKYLIDNGYTVELYDGKTEPYKNSEEMLKDLRDNKHLYVFSTEKGFGDTPITEKDRQENPLLKDSGFTDKNGKKLLINDAFRFVHDIFGHGERGNSFGAKGEENAWDVHSRMYSPEARRAMTTETRGQNSWVNFNKGMRNEDGSIKKKGDKGYLSPTERPFADQKIGLLPEWVSKSIYETAEPTKKNTEKAKELADKVRSLDLPDWLKANIDGGKKQGVDADSMKEALAKAIEKTGELMDKGIEFAEAVKEAINDIVNLLGEDKRASIEKDFADYYQSTQKPLEMESKGLDVISKGVANMDDFFNEMSKDEDFNSLTEDQKKDLYYNSVSKYSTSQAVDQAAQAPKLIDLKDQSWLKKFIQAFQNKMIRVKDVQEQMEGALGIKILKEANVALKFELLVGKTINIIEDKQKEIFDKSNKNSWANRAKKDGVDIDQLGTYMYALHAEERNLANATEREENFKKEVDALNEKIKNAETKSLKTRYENELKKLISGQGKVKLLKEAGSGMTNEQAQEIIDNVEKSGKKELFDKYASEFREKVIKPALDDKLKYGLIDQELYDKLQTQYKNYVPLQVVEKAMTKRAGGAGAGASVKGRDIFKAKGSDLYKYTDRYNPIFSSMFEYQNTVARGERNQAAQALINLAELDKNNEVFEVHKPKYTAILDSNGDIKYMLPTTSQKLINDSVELKVDGKPVYVEVKDKAMRDALQNQGIQRGIRGLYIVNSWIRSTATLMNPNFLITNFLRDYQSALINIQSEIKDLDIKNVTGQIANPKNLKSAGKGIIQDSKGNYDSEWAKLAKEYRDSGGKVSWFQKETLEEYVDSLRKDIEKINKGEKMYTAALNKLGNTLMLAQSVVEQSVRLSTFKALKDAGASTEEAARAAKNITVNFENKGTWGGLMDSLYLFATAGLSGTVRMATSLAKSKTARTIAGGMFAYGILEAALNSHLGGDDDDDEKIDDGIKERNFVLVNPKDSKQEPLLLPMAYGLNVFKYAGNLTYDVATGRKDATEATSKMFMTIYNQISPLQGPTLSQAVAPTAFDPFVQQSENKNFFGAPIKPEQPKFGAKKKESDLYFESVRPGSLWTAKKLNEWTGGSAMEKGYIDISPEILDHYYDALGGGTGKFISDVGYTGKIAAKEVVESIHGKEMKDKDEFSLRRLPFVKAFFGSKPEKKELQYIYETFERSAIDQLSKEEVTKFTKQLKEAVKSQALERQDAKQMYNTVMEGQYKIKKYKGVQEVRPADMTKKQYIKFIKGAN